MRLEAPCPEKEMQPAHKAGSGLGGLMCSHSGGRREGTSQTPEAAGQAGREEPLPSGFLVREVRRISQEGTTGPPPAAWAVGLAGGPGPQWAHGSPGGSRLWSNIGCHLISHVFIMTELLSCETPVSLAHFHSVFIG